MGNLFSLGPFDNPGLLKAAALIIEAFGVNAVQQAAARIMTLEQAGDAMGAEAWRRVLPVVEGLLAGNTG